MGKNQATVSTGNKYMSGGVQYHVSRGTRKVIMTPINPNLVFE